MEKYRTMAGGGCVRDSYAMESFLERWKEDAGRWKVT
jgi:hypothetical protein